jgi:membrane protein required for colicin V production
VSMMRGAVREVLAIVGWVAAIYAAKTYATQLVPLLPADIPTEQLRILAAYVIVFLGVLLVSSLLTIALSSLIKKIGLNWFNRFLGGFFGLVRGLLIVCVLVFLAGLTSFPKDARWTNAMFSAPLEALVKSALPWVPQMVAKHVKYD